MKVQEKTKKDNVINLHDQLHEAPPLPVSDVGVDTGSSHQGPEHLHLVLHLKSQRPDQVGSKYYYSLIYS